MVPLFNYFTDQNDIFIHKFWTAPANDANDNGLEMSCEQCAKSKNLFKYCLQLERD